MKTRILLNVLLLFFAVSMSAQNATSGKLFADFYVATNGNDQWSGTLSAPNADGTDGPFATIGRAKEAVRQFKHGRYRDIFVMIRGGEYRLSQTEVFTARDGHYDSYAVRYMAYPDEQPVFHSDIPVTGWQRPKHIKGLPTVAQGKVYVAPIPKGSPRFHVLYDDGKMQTRAHSQGLEPRESVKGGDGGGVDWKGLQEADRTLLKFNRGELKAWDNLDDIEVFILPNVGYVTNYLPLAAVDEQRCEARTAVTATYPMGRVDKHLHAINGGSYQVENVLDYLDEPGEWVVNTHECKIYYWPRSGQPGKVTVPALVQYFFVDGHERGEVVSNIAFKGLTFTRSDREVISADDTGLQHDWDMWNKANAMLRFRDAAYCEVIGCRFTNGGSAGVRFDLLAQSNVIRNNLVEHLGGTGILLCGYGPGRKDESKCNRIENNEVHHCGQLYYQSCGIMVWQSGENVVKNNYLHHLPYDAIVLSGARPMFFNMTEKNREIEGSIRRNEISPEAQYQPTDSRQAQIDHYMRVAPYSLTRNNLVQDNEVFSTMQTMFDGNAIYLSDVGFGNVVRRNYIHHLTGQGMQQAIRTDAFIKKTTITENIIYDCNGGGINVKLFDNHVTNNIVADINDIKYQNSKGDSVRQFLGYVSLLEVYDRSEMPPHASLQVRHNIFYKTHRHNTFYREAWVNGKKKEVKIEQADIDQNLYFDVEADDKGASFLQAYRQRGADSLSIAADPLFVDIAHGDFRLKPGSPAYQIGFQDIDMSQIGLRPDFPWGNGGKVSPSLGGGRGEATIMGMGDSITEGGDTFSAYLSPLKRMLEEAGVNCRFIGVKERRSDGIRYRHSGYGGKTVEFLESKTDSIYSLYPADIVLLHAGHNHFVEEKPVGSIVESQLSIIRKIHRLNPKAVIIVAGVIHSGKLPKYSYIPELNQALKKAVDNLHDSRVVFADVSRGFQWEKHTIKDRVHPNKEGAAIMARNWQDALQPYLNH